MIGTGWQWSTAWMTGEGGGVCLVSGPFPTSYLPSSRPLYWTTPVLKLGLRFEHNQQVSPGPYFARTPANTGSQIENTKTECKVIQLHSAQNARDALMKSIQCFTVECFGTFNEGKSEILNWLNYFHCKTDSSVKFLLKILDGDRQCHNILTRQSGMYCVIVKKALFSTQLRWYTAHLWQKKQHAET